jgi:hypothetical protein
VPLLALSSSEYGQLPRSDLSCAGGLSRKLSVGVENQSGKKPFSVFALLE